MLLELVEGPTLTKTDGTKMGTLATADAGKDAMMVTKVEVPETTVTGKPASEAMADGAKVRVEIAEGAAPIAVAIVVD